MLIVAVGNMALCPVAEGCLQSNSDRSLIGVDGSQKSDPVLNGTTKIRRDSCWRSTAPTLRCLLDSTARVLGSCEIGTHAKRLKEGMPQRCQDGIDFFRYAPSHIPD